MDNIQVQITQEDANQAGSYFNGQSCLLATTLKREGHEIEGVAGSNVRFANGNRYKIEEVIADDLAGDDYPQGLVGRTVTLTFLNRWKGQENATSDI